MNPEKMRMLADTDSSPDKLKEREYIDRFNKGALGVEDLTPEYLGDSYDKVIDGLIQQIPPNDRGKNWPPDLVSDMWNPAIPVDADAAERQRTIRSIALQAYTNRWNATPHTNQEVTGESSTQIQPTPIETNRPPINNGELPNTSVATDGEKPDLTTNEEPDAATYTDNIQLETTSGLPDTVDMNTAEPILEIPQDQAVETIDSPQIPAQNQERINSTVSEEQQKEIRAFEQGLEHFCKIIGGRERQGFSTQFIPKEALQKIYEGSQKFTRALETQDIKLAEETLRTTLMAFDSFGKVPNRSSAVNENLRSLEELKNNLHNTHHSLGSIYRRYTKNNETGECNSLLETINRFGHRLDRAHELVKKLEGIGRDVLRRY